ncbi:protein NRT1/ PTR FAMILY 2.9-like [Actinidia eriantha]|uniref:protein NRT1/ PTR FAMILY 2.9-like n=1 Tax=Actinidia eriantha TaxID=165200 RepID=UPI002590B44E|nr:protein NRT1/ PTR FAMILY 2.9-like [Actinidia eriantha]
MEKNENETVEKNKAEFNYRGVKAMPFIIGNETFEKLGAIGTLANLLIYLTSVFNMKSITATTLVNVFNGTTNFATLLGAFLSDTYFGRYKTLGFATIASFLGLLVIALTAAIKKLHPPRCSSKDSSACIGPTEWQMAFLLTFLDKAAIMTPDDQINPDGSAANPWRLCSMQQVEEVKCLLRMIPIWASAIVYHVSIVQQNTYVVFQALQSNRHVGKTTFQIPAATYPVFNMLTLTLWIPIYDRILIPMLRRLTEKQGGITVLQRMGIGIALSVLTSLVAAIVEKWRRTLALTKTTLGIERQQGAISSMPALWLVPQVSLAGLAEAFMAIGQVEFYYKQFPENMRSIAGSFFFCGMAASSYLSGFLVSIVHHTTHGAGTADWLPEDLNKGRLEYFYYLVAGLGAINLGYFFVCSVWYRYKGTGGNDITVEMEKRQLDKPLV